MDIASLLIKHNTDVNATDRWLFTPLHEASQKGRTQLCALLVSDRLYKVAFSFSMGIDCNKLRLSITGALPCEQRFCLAWL